LYHFGKQWDTGGGFAQSAEPMFIPVFMEVFHLSGIAICNNEFCLDSRIKKRLKVEGELIVRIFIKNAV
jgi:hypothetical protein